MYLLLPTLDSSVSHSHLILATLNFHVHARVQKIYIGWQEDDVLSAYVIV